jgi:hypothetical protein
MEIDRIIEDLEDQIALGKSIKEEVDVLFLTRKDYNIYRKYNNMHKVDIEGRPNYTYKGINVGLMKL